MRPVAVQQVQQVRLSCYAIGFARAVTVVTRGDTAPGVGPAHCIGQTIAVGRPVMAKALCAGYTHSGRKGSSETLGSIGMRRAPLVVSSLALGGP